MEVLCVFRILKKYLNVIYLVEKGERYTNTFKCINRWDEEPMVSYTGISVGRGGGATSAKGWIQGGQK